MSPKPGARSWIATVWSAPRDDGAAGQNFPRAAQAGCFFMRRHEVACTSVAVRAAPVRPWMALPGVGGAIGEAGRIGWRAGIVETLQNRCVTIEDVNGCSINHLFITMNKWLPV